MTRHPEVALVCLLMAGCMSASKVRPAEVSNRHITQSQLPPWIARCLDDHAGLLHELDAVPNPSDALIEVVVRGTYDECVTTYGPPPPADAAAAARLLSLSQQPTTSSQAPSAVGSWLDHVAAEWSAIAPALAAPAVPAPATGTVTLYGRDGTAFHGSLPSNGGTATFYGPRGELLHGVVR